MLILQTRVPHAVDPASTVRTCLKRDHLYRTGAVTLVVGTWLTLFNQGDVLVSQSVNATLTAKIALNYLTPFVVANLGLLSHQTE